MVLKIANEIKNLISSVIINYPASSIGMRMRALYYRKTLKTIGAGCSIGRGAYIGVKGLVSIGNNFQLGDQASIDAGDSLPIFIGNFVAIARHSYIRSANHSFDDLTKPIMFQGHNFKTIEYRDGTYSVVIEDDVWVGANSVITSGAFIGRGSVIGANSVVSSTIPPYSIVMGNPARVVGSRQPIKSKT